MTTRLKMYTVAFFTICFIAVVLQSVAYIDPSVSMYRVEVLISIVVFPFYMVFIFPELRRQKESLDTLHAVMMTIAWLSYSLFGLAWLLESLFSLVSIVLTPVQAMLSAFMIWMVVFPFAFKALRKQFLREGNKG